MRATNERAHHRRPPQSNDKQQAQLMLTQVLVNTEQVPRTVSMDAGYFSEANVTASTALGCWPLIPLDRQLHSQTVTMALRGRPPVVNVNARGAAGIGQKPEGRAESPRVVEDRRASVCGPANTGSTGKISLCSGQCRTGSSSTSLSVSAGAHMDTMSSIDWKRNDGFLKNTEDHARHVGRFALFGIRSLATLARRDE